MGAVNDGKVDSDNKEKNYHHYYKKSHDWRQKKFLLKSAKALSDLREIYVMSAHIETRRKLRDVSLVADFEHIMNECTISEEDKNILRLHYIENKDFRFIGDTLGYSERTIKARHHRALKKFKMHFDRPYGRSFFAFLQNIQNFYFL